MKKIVTAVAIASALALAGCASQPAQNASTNKETTSNTGTSTTGTEGGATQTGMPMQGMHPKAGPESSYDNRVVYFDTDQSVVKPEFFPLLRRQADYLNSHSNEVVMLEGYADERGTREYNIGLGARRSAAVQKFLLLQGVDKDQIKTISYGEAYPADPGHNAAAWAKNRRVIINFHPEQGRSGQQ